MNRAVGVTVTRDPLSNSANAESALVEQFRARLLGAKRSTHQNRPWVMVTPIHQGQTLLSVYYALKLEGTFDEWSSEFYDVRKNAGICVFALMP